VSFGTVFQQINRNKRSIGNRTRAVENAIFFAVVRYSLFSFFEELNCINNKLAWFRVAECLQVYRLPNAVAGESCRVSSTTRNLPPESSSFLQFKVVLLFVYSLQIDEYITDSEM